jgi:hypothetical protein
MQYDPITDSLLDDIVYQAEVHVDRQVPRPFTEALLHLAELDDDQRRETASSHAETICGMDR